MKWKITYDTPNPCPIKLQYLTISQMSKISINNNIIEKSRSSYLETSTNKGNCCNFNRIEEVNCGKVNDNYWRKLCYGCCRTWRPFLMQPLKWFCSHQSKRRKRSERVKERARYCEFWTWFLVGKWEESWLFIDEWWSAECWLPFI